MIIDYRIHDVAPYINWIYFFHAWGFQPRFAAVADIHGCDACRASWLAAFPEDERCKAAEAMQLLKEANRLLDRLDEDIGVKAIYRLCEANSDGDDLLLDGTPLPLLRQQTRKSDSEPFLCLSDFVRPLSSGMKDTVGVFSCAVDEALENIYPNDPYKSLLVRTLAERLAEAATEKMHEFIRKEAWGYAPGERLSVKQLLNEDFQGIRPAVGYPSLPDLSVNFILNILLRMEDAGIRLTENGAMIPRASVSGLMISHSAARYFSVGKIGEDQLNDYANRRGLPTETMKKFLAANL